MKHNGMVYAAMVSVMLIGSASIGYAQQDDQNGNKDKQDKQAQGDKQQKDSHGGQQQGQRHEEQQQPTRNEREHPANTAPQAGQSHGNWQQNRATHFDTQHQTWAQRGGYKGFRVPDDQFGRNFGSGHSFHVYGLPYKDEGGLARFEYGGYWLSMMEPYPEYWGTDWDRNDDMYVDFSDGGYYLYDRRFPGRPGVALSISF